MTEYRIMPVENGFLVQQGHPITSATGSCYYPKTWVARTPEELALLIVELFKPEVKK